MSKTVILTWTAHWLLPVLSHPPVGYRINSRHVVVQSLQSCLLCDGTPEEIRTIWEVSGRDDLNCHGHSVSVPHVHPQTAESHFLGMNKRTKTCFSNFHGFPSLLKPRPLLWVQKKFFLVSTEAWRGKVLSFTLCWRPLLANAVWQKWTAETEISLYFRGFEDVCECYFGP